MTRLLLVALDGATLDLVGPWMAAGHLPSLRGLFERGAGGILRSTVPWTTPTAFASLATGTQAGKHGVYDFGRLIGRNYGAFVPTNGADVRGRTLWSILNEAGLTCGLVNMPMTYPAPHVDGFAISGIPYPGKSRRICHPPQLLAQLRERGWDLALNASDDLGGSYRQYHQGLLDLVQARVEASLWLMDTHDPDVMAIHFLETDQAQHRFWQFMPGEPRYDPGGPHTNAIRRVFAQIDQGLGAIVEHAGPEATVCVMSDHGSGPIRHHVWTNNWLIEHGYLRLKRSPWVRLKQIAYRTGLSPAAIREAAPERLKLALLRFFERQKGRAIASELERGGDDATRKGLLDRLTELVAIDFGDVDWGRTRAFSTGTSTVGYVWLNLEGREPQGIVRPGEDRERTRHEIANALRAWDAVGEVALAEDLWQGPALAQAPDLVITWADPTIDARYFQTRISSPHLIKPVPNDYAGHRPEGLYAFAGPGVRTGTVLEADLVDLTPTLLWLLEQPVPAHMDGRALTKCFALDRPVVTVQSREYLPETEEELSAEDEEAIRASLRGLGYLD